MSRIVWKILSFVFFAYVTGLLPAFAFCENLKVGVLLHLTGDLTDFGQMQKDSLLIAQEEMRNRYDEVKAVELIFQDTPTRPEQVCASVENLINKERVAIIIGGTSSAAAWEAALAAQSYKIPFLITGSTEDKLTEQGWEYVFRLNPPLSEYGNGLLWFLSEVVKPRTIAVLRAKGFTGRLSSSEMIEYCRKAGYEIVFDHVYDETTTDFRPVLRQIKEKDPDIITMASFLNDAVHIMRQSKELDINPLLFVGLGGGFTLPQFGELAVDAANCVCAVSVWNPSVPYVGSREYYEKYLKIHSARPDFHGAEIYAAMEVFGDALHRCESRDPEGLRKALLSTDMTTIIGRVKFISYGKKTQQNRLPTYLVQWIDGDMKTVWPPAVARHKYIYPFPGWKE
jgi:branched-chain amino acid transport system substrate-binding protein